jgi:hypothetical protein
MVQRNQLSAKFKKSQKNPKVTCKTQAQTKPRRNRTSLWKKKPTKGRNQGLLGLQQG